MTEPVAGCLLAQRISSASADEDASLPLPLDLWILILSQLPVSLMAAIGRLAVVCRGLVSIGWHPMVWER